MKPYPEYKDSGVKWIGEIPVGWLVKKIKHISQTISKGTTPSTIGKQVLVEGEIRFLRAENIINNKVVKNPQFFIDEETNNILKRSILVEGDILFVIAASIGKVAILHKEFCPANTNQAIAFIRLNNSEMKSYVWYWLTTSKIQEQVILDAVQSAQPNLSMEDLGNFSIPFPPKSEQTQIANYLNTKTQQIDQLIQNKQQKIKLLQEKQTAVINQAVTKGLNPEVEMKDSGVEWIGEIPKGWNLVQMNHYATKLTNGFVGVTRDIMKDRGIPYIQGIHIKDRQIKFTPDGFYYVTAEWSNSHSKSILKNGDILVVQTGSIGQVALVTEEYEGANCHALIIVRLSDEHCVGTFLSYFFLSNYMQSFLQQIKTGEILHHLNTTKIKYAKILLPPLSEQQQIVSYLDTKTQQIDNLISKEQRKIELLQEYRQSLISDAVTGKIDVREAG